MCSEVRTHSSYDESFFPNPSYLSGPAVPVIEHITRCHRDTCVSSPSNRCPESHKQLHLQDLPINPALDPVHALGTVLQSQEEGYCSFLPPPSWVREGSHAREEILTLCLNSVFSSKVMVSALAITGMMFTTLLRCFMNSRSKGRRLQPKREQHGRGHFTRLAFYPSDSASIRASMKPPLYIPCLLPPWSHLLLPIHPALSQKTQWRFSCLCYPRLFQALQHPKLS